MGHPQNQTQTRTQPYAKASPKSRLTRLNQQHRQHELNQQRRNQANRAPEQQRETWDAHRYPLENNPIAPGLLIFMLANSGLFTPPSANAQETRAGSASPATREKSASETQSHAHHSHSDIVDQASLLHSLTQQTQSTGKSTTASSTIHHDKNKPKQEQRATFTASNGGSVQINLASEDELRTRAKSNPNLNQEQIDRIFPPREIQDVFREAAHENISLERFRELLTAYPELTQYQDKDRNTLLHCLAKNNKKSDYIRAVLRTQPKPNLIQTNLKHESPIHVALNQFHPKNILAFIEVLSKSECEKILPPLRITLSETQKTHLVFPIPAMLGQAAVTNANEQETVILLNHLLQKTPYDYTLDKNLDIAKNLLNACFKYKKYDLLIWLVKNNIPFPNNEEKHYLNIDIVLLNTYQCDADDATKALIYNTLHKQRPHYFQMRNVLATMDSDMPGLNAKMDHRLKKIIKAIPVISENKHIQEKAKDPVSLEKLKEYLKGFANIGPKEKIETYRMFYFFSGDDHFNEQLKLMLEAGLDSFQMVTDNTSSFEAALKLGQVKNLKTYLDFYSKNNPTQLKNFLKSLASPYTKKHDLNPIINTAYTREPLDFMIQKLYTETGKNALPALNTLLSIYPQFETLDGLFEVTSFAAENNHLELLKWLFKRKLFFTQKSNVNLKFSHKANEGFGIIQGKKDSYDATLSILSIIVNNNKITPETKENFYELFLKTINITVLLNEMIAHHLTLSNQINNIKAQDTNANLCHLNGQLKDLKNLIHLIQKKARLSLENFEPPQNNASLLIPILITIASLSAGFGIYWCAEKTDKTKSEQQRIDDFANALQDFSTRLGINIDEDSCQLNISEKHANHLALKEFKSKKPNQVIKINSEKRDELKLSIRDYIMIPSAFFPKEESTPLYHYQGISYVILKRADYAKAIAIAANTLSFPVKITSNKMILDATKFTSINPKILSNFSDCFIRNLNLKNTPSFIEISNLQKEFDSIDLSELEKNISSADTESQRAFRTITEILNELKNRLSNAKPLLKSNQRLDLSSNTKAIRFERNAAALWKEESQSLQKDIAKLKSRIHSLKLDIKTKMDQEISAANLCKNPPQQPIENSNLSKKKQKQDDKQRWKFSGNSSSNLSDPNSSSSARSSNTDSIHHKDNSNYSEEITHSTPMPTTTHDISKRSNLSTTESKAPNQKKLPQAEAVNTEGKIKEKAKAKTKGKMEAGLTEQALSAKQKERVKLLSNYLDQILTLSSNAQLDETRIGALRYLLMRTCVLLRALSRVSHSTWDINFSRNSLIHSLCIQDGIPEIHLLTLAKDLSETKLPSPYQPACENKIKSKLTHLINIIGNSKAHQVAIPLLSSWNTAKEQSEEIIDSITPLDALTRISEHLQAIKKLFELKDAPSSSSQTFFKTPLSDNNISAHAIRWRVCAIHLCLELCPSLNEHPDIKKFGLDAFFKSIVALRWMTAHKKDELGFNEALATLETLFRNQSATILLEINSIKFGLASLKKT